VDFEFLILADAAQAVGGKLYMLGGGWDVLTISSSFPARHPFSIALGLRVPWNETNQMQNVGVEIVDEDGNPAAAMSGQVEVGRPAGLPAGQSQLVVLAFNGMMEVKRPGGFAIIGKIEGQEAKRLHFRVVAKPGIAAPPPQPSA
jgi:hypothetical protein